MFETPDANKEFVDFWNEILVPKFQQYRHILVDGLTHHSAKVLPSLEVATGDRVLDVGCGFGDTAIELARRVAPNGSVRGIDCCEAFLRIARDDAATAGVNNVAFIEGDAQDSPFEPEYDFCFSRFGTMFFHNPVAGLRNMRRALVIVGKTPTDAMGFQLALGPAGEQTASAWFTRSQPVPEWGLRNIVFF